MKRNVMTRVLYASIALHKKHFRILPKLLWMFNRVFFSADVPCTINMSNDVTFGHNGLGVVINGNAEIGEKTLIMQHVTIGGSLGKKKEKDGMLFSSPKIGKHTLVGAGAILLGPIIIGDNCIIGAGTIVTCNVPDNSVVVGNPGRIIRPAREDELNKF